MKLEAFACHVNFSLLWRCVSFLYIHLFNVFDREVHGRLLLVNRVKDHCNFSWPDSWKGEGERLSVVRHKTEDEAPWRTMFTYFWRCPALLGPSLFFFSSNLSCVLYTQSSCLHQEGNFFYSISSSCSEAAN